jgi:hypothetical protein
VPARRPRASRDSVRGECGARAEPLPGACRAGAGRVPGRRRGQNRDAGAARAFELATPGSWQPQDERTSARLEAFPSRRSRMLHNHAPGGSNPLRRVSQAMHDYASGAYRYGLRAASCREAHKEQAFWPARGNRAVDAAHPLPDAVWHELPSLKHPGSAMVDARQGCRSGPAPSAFRNFRYAPIPEVPSWVGHARKRSFV